VQKIDLRSKYVPFETQTDFHTNPNRYKLFGGAMGGGKSYALAAEGLQLSLDYPGNVGYVGRLDFTDLRRTTYLSFLEVIPQELILQHHQSEHWIKLKNGSTIYFGELKDIESLKSLNLGWFAIDEASEVAEEAFLMLSSRLRLKIPNIKYYGIMASNPEPGWLKDRFVDEQRENHAFIPSLPKDNPHLPEEYISNLRANFPEIWVKRYLEGSWDVFEGQIFTEYDNAKHVVDPFTVPKEWEFGVSIDPGFVNPTGILLWAVDFDGTVHFIQESYESGITVSQNVERIKPWYDDYPISIELIDPAARAKTREKNGQLWSVMDEYMDYGINPVPANNEVLAGINRVNEYLKRSRIKIFRSCVNLIKEIPGYQWQKLSPAQLGHSNYPEKPRKLNDHLVDAMRYTIMSRPDIPITKEVREKMPDNYPMIEDGDDMTKEREDIYEEIPEDML